MATTTLVPPPAFRFRLALIGALIVLAIGFLATVPPFAQDVTYHDFADQRTLLQVPHALNVLSNVPFIVFGLVAIRWLLRRDVRQSADRFLASWEWWTYLFLFTFVTLTGIGSAYYHANPNNDTLYWDRLPLTVVFMTFFTLIVAERIGPRVGLWLLAPMVAFGVFGVTYWRWTELQGAGDVRVYGLVQFFPLVAIPALLLLFPARFTGTGALWAILAWYGLAKLLEWLDQAIYAANGYVSGHTMKHLVAALGAYWILLMLQRRRRIVS